MQEVDVLEVSICSSYGNVQNEVEILIKWGILVASLAPRIMQSTVVDNRLPKVSAIPHVIVLRLKIDEENLQQPVVDVSEKVLLTPLQAICSETVAVVCAPHVVFSLGPPKGIGRSNRSPVERRANTVSSIWESCARIASAFCNVNFSICWPVAIHAILGHHPEIFLAEYKW
jgi:hypothetical protein